MQYEKIRNPRDPRRIRYFISDRNEIWCGIEHHDGNLNFGLLGTGIISASDVPSSSVEITPLQAAEHLAMELRENERIKALCDAKRV